MRWFILLLNLVLLHALGSSAPPPHIAGRALLISDIHLDPVANPAIVKQLIAAPATRWTSIFRSSRQQSLSKSGSDANYFLFSSALKAAAAQGPFDYVVFTGDALRHGFEAAFVSAGGTSNEYAAFAAKAEVYVIQELQRELGAPVLAAIGNNDSSCGDYRLYPNDPFLAAVADRLTVLMKSPEAKATFQFGGFYSVPHPSIADQDVIVLNSVFWSNSYSSCAPNTGDAGSAELDWLSWKLYTAKILHRAVTLVMHIPPGIDAFSSSQGNCNSAAPFWADRYSARFYSLMQTYSDIVQIAFAGHTHMDDFLLWNTGTPAVPVRITPAISALFKNNPGFLVLSYDLKTGAVSDFTTFFISLSSTTPQWAKEYQFSATYGVSGFNASSLATITAGIRTDDGIRQRFENMYAVSAPSPINSSNWGFYSCQQTELTEANYSKCVCAGSSTPKP